MTHSSNISDTEAIYKLLTSYSFDVEAYQIEAVITDWLTEFGPVWVSHAITEALYQGRYKLVSVDQILKLWQRRGQPIRHFNREFESIILGQTLLYPTSYGDGSEASSIRRTGPPASSAASTTPQPALGAPDPAVNTGTDPVEAKLTSPDSQDSNRQDAFSVAASEPVAEAEKGIAEEPLPQETFENPFATPAQAQKTVALGAETPPRIPNFRPLATEEPAPWHQVDVIQPFVPRHDESELHERLRAVVKGGMQE